MNEEFFNFLLTYHIFLKSNQYNFINEQFNLMPDIFWQLKNKEVKICLRLILAQRLY